MTKKMYIQNIGIHNVDRATFFLIFKEYLTKNAKKTIGFINAHCVNIARKDKEYKECINDFDLILPDGIGLYIAGLAKKTPIVENLNGTDLIPQILKEITLQKKSVFLLGGTEEVIKRSVKNLNRQQADMKIVGYMSGYFDVAKEGSVIDAINARKPDLLLVAMGVPKQEKWICRNKDKVNSKIIIAVGGFFDFMAGTNRRAPKFMRRLGMEWIYRIYQEPKRMWRRYVFGIPEFLYHTLKETLKTKKK